MQIYYVNKLLKSVVGTIDSFSRTNQIHTFFFSLIAHVDSLPLAIIPDQSCRANEMYDFIDK